MPTAYGAEFRQDVIDVSRKGETSLAQIAKDFGLSVTPLNGGLPSPSVRNPEPARHRPSRPSRPGTGRVGRAGPAPAELRELKKRNRAGE